MNYIEVHDLSFVYEEHPVLQHVSMAVQDGEFVVLAGENGAAKSTLLRTILGEAKPAHGTARMAVRNSHGHPLKVGYLPQQIAAFNAGFPSTVYELVASGRFQRGRWFRPLREHDRQHIQKALTAVGMWEWRKHRIGELSGGQKQRVCLARIFAADPDLFILDEPTTGMDIETRAQFYQLLRHEVHAHGKSILMVSHDNDNVMDFADRQVRLVRMEGTQWRCFSMASCNAH